MSLSSLRFLLRVACLLGEVNARREGEFPAPRRAAHRRARVRENPREVLLMSTTVEVPEPDLRAGGKA